MPLYAVILCVFSNNNVGRGEFKGGLANIAEVADMACGLGGEKKRRLRTEGVRSLGIWLSHGRWGLGLFVMRGLFAGGIEEGVVLFGVED